VSNCRKSCHQPGLYSQVIQPACRWLFLGSLLSWVWVGAVGLGQPAPTVPPTTTPSPAPALPLKPVPLPLGLGSDEQIFGATGWPSDRTALLVAIDHSLRYLETANAVDFYRTYSVPGITRDRVRRSLERFRQLVLSARTASQLQRAVKQEFIFYQARGKDGRGTVGFTGYFEPVYLASRVPTPVYRYPLFRLPADLKTWPKPHPTRLELEGTDGLQAAKGRLKGLELVWLRDRLEAFLIQVQGSARLKLTDGSTLTVGYAGHTDSPYTGIGRELVKDGKLKPEELLLPFVIRYFRQHPEDLSIYLPRNQRFVFMRETGGNPATGHLNAPVTPERSIATDKTLFPPGALALIQTQIPYATKAGQLEQRPVTRYVLNQDTGGAILGPGRVDIFMGTGQRAGDRAGLINATGQLYFLLLKQ